jgi:predicted small lipoprotein YifL
MRTVICGTSLLLATLTLVGCGQTGDLMLPSDPQENRHTKYILYKDAQTPAEKKTQQTAEIPSATPVATETK